VNKRKCQLASQARPQEGEISDNLVNGILERDIKRMELLLDRGWDAEQTFLHVALCWPLINDNPNVLWSFAALTLP